MARNAVSGKEKKKGAFHTKNAEQIFCCFCATTVFVQKEAGFAVCAANLSRRPIKK